MTEEIENMSFKDLCTLVKGKYNDLLLESAYESPESLSRALEAIKENKGFKLRYQVRTYLILRACVKMPQRIFTVMDISKHSGLSKNQVSECISRWMKYDFRYITQLPKRKGLGGAYRYKLRKHGTEVYIALKHRIRKGYDLNRMKYIPEKIDCYYFITEVGKAKGLTEADLPIIDID